VEDEERPGRPSTSKTEDNVEKISGIVQKDRCLSIQMIAEIVNMDKETVRQILHYQLNMRKVCAIMVLINLTQEQKDNSEKHLLTSWNKSQNRMCLKMSSHVMKHGFFNTIQKQ
jgi:hypothetical protein